MTTKVGLLSRLDYGLDAYRRGLITSALNLFKKEKVNFICIVGGVMDSRFNWRDYIKLMSFKLNKKFTKDDIEKLKEQFLEEAVKELSSVLDSISITGIDVKYYIVISPVHDKLLGEEIVEKIAKKRKDVFYKGKRKGVLEIKGFGRDKEKKYLHVLTPNKSAWLRGDYYSTPIQRVIGDELKINKKKLPLVYAVGCFGASMFKPSGNEPVPYCGIPMISEPKEIKVQENHVGCGILEIHNDESITYTTYGLKDLLANEKEYIKLPYLHAEEKRIIEAFKSFESAPTIGQLEEESGINREKIQNLLKESKKLSSIVRPSSDGKLYSIYWSDIIQYPEIKIKVVDRLIGFGCLHMWNRWTDYKCFKDELPKVIAENEVNYVIGGGDFQEGLEHNLILEKEVLGGLNSSEQEEDAAGLVAHVLYKSFQLKLEKRNKKYADIKDVKELLPQFVYIPGNHCAWSLKHGYTPLKLFGKTLREELFEKVKTIFKNHDCMKLEEVIKSKLIELDVYNPIHQTESGIPFAIFHPHLPRAKTLSVRAQEVNSQTSSMPSIVNFIFNFHIHFSLQAWSPDKGDILAVQGGTIKVKSRFEYLKLKNVDFGFVLVEVGLNDENRLAYSKVRYFNKPTGKLIHPDDVRSYLRSRVYE